MNLKFSLLISLSLSLLFSYFNIETIQGFGEKRNIEDPASLSMGNSWYFSGQTNGVSIKSNSTHWRNRLSQVSSSFSIRNNKFEKYSSQSQQVLNYLHFQFPIGKKQSFAFTLSPSTRINYHFSDSGLVDENIVFNDLVINSNQIYYGSGGITDMMLTYSTAINNDFSIGISWNIGFGSFTKIDTIEINNIISESYDEYNFNNIFTDIYQIRSTYNANSFNIGSLFSIPKIEVASSITFDYNLKINQKKDYFSNNSSYTEFLSTITNSTESGFNIREFGAGLNYKLSKSSGIIFEIHKNGTRSIDENFLLFSNLKEETHSLHFGTYKWIPTNNYKILNTLILRGGAFVEKSNNFLDMGLTIGSGFEYFNNSSFINMGCKFGMKKSKKFIVNNESYFEFIISFTSSDKWFK